MIRRSWNVPQVNALLERDFPGLDFSEMLAEPLNVVLIGDDKDGAAFAWRGPGIYEAHVFFAVRGKAAIRLARTMLNFMADAHGARLFWTLIPEGSRHVKLFARLLGFKSLGPTLTRHGPHELFSLEMI